MDLVQGTGLHRPLARPGATAPRGHRRLDWFLASAGLLPSLGWEEVTGYKPGLKPDHSAVSIEIQSAFLATQYLGVRKAPTPNLADAAERFQLDTNEWERAKAQQDVECLWELWNAAATEALEVGPQGRGRLCLQSKTLQPPKEDQETKQEGLRQHLEAGVLRTVRTGQAVLAHAWPSWLGVCPPTAQAQRELLEGRALL
eukprot:5704270-Amphidinium_carterae.1